MQNNAAPKQTSFGDLIQQHNKLVWDQLHPDTQAIANQVPVRPAVAGAMATTARPNVDINGSQVAVGEVPIGPWDMPQVGLGNNTPTIHAGIKYNDSNNTQVKPNSFSTSPDVGILYVDASGRFPHLSRGWGHIAIKNGKEVDSFDPSGFHEIPFQKFINDTNSSHNNMPGQNIEFFLLKAALRISHNLK